jgi:hypothetical protein
MLDNIYDKNFTTLVLYDMTKVKNKTTQKRGFIIFFLGKNVLAILVVSVF